jgi:hypothetical protein
MTANHAFTALSGNEQIRFWLQKHKRLAGVFVNRLASNLYRHIQSLTPVDTGRARDGWRMEAETEASYLIYNPVDYIICLEHGSSRKAPQGMLKATLAEKEAHARQTAQETGWGE